MYEARPSLKSSLYTLDDCVATVFLRACCEKPNSYQDEFAIGGFPECVTVIARGLNKVQAC